MSIWRRLQKDNQRRQEVNSTSGQIQSRTHELMELFRAANTPDHPSFDELNKPLNLWNLRDKAKSFRDDMGRLNLNGFAAIASTIHWRTEAKINVSKLSGKSKLNFPLTDYGCLDLDILFTDLRYIYLGVENEGVNPEEFLDCEQFVELFKDAIIRFIDQEESLGGKPGMVPVKSFSNPNQIVLVNKNDLIGRLKPSIPHPRPSSLA